MIKVLRRFRQVSLVQHNNDFIIVMPYSKIFYKNFTIACEQFEKVKYNY